MRWVARRSNFRQSSPSGSLNSKSASTGKQSTSRRDRSPFELPRRPGGKAVKHAQPVARRRRLEQAPQAAAVAADEQLVGQVIAAFGATVAAHQEHDLPLRHRTAVVQAMLRWVARKSGNTWSRPMIEGAIDDDAERGLAAAVSGDQHHGFAKARIGPCPRWRSAAGIGWERPVRPHCEPGRAISPHSSIRQDEAAAHRRMPRRRPRGSGGDSAGTGMPRRSSRASQPRITR
jgi:hypothetical protein